MPVFRNVTPKSQFGTLEEHIYDGNGSWPITQNTKFIPYDSMLQYPASSPSSLGSPQYDRQYSQQEPEDSMLQYPTSPPPSLGSPQYDRQYSQQEPEDSMLQYPTSSPSSQYDRQYSCISSINTSPLPPKESHPRRQPGHISCPRNAFIIFCSEFISGRIRDGQQNELSKEAGKVWNAMTQDEKDKFTALAEVEKKFHQEKPDYVYSPRDSTKRKGTKKVKKKILQFIHYVLYIYISLCIQ
ncbi:hypothetical protein BYT27DRAFT_7240855 [Phlegmacium glaucopus]|nr:hypothetical protein BYT27DRAFT_7240855 [Phlegmacium glaucopus]